MISEIDGKQPGDPLRAAKIILSSQEIPNPPDKLLLGAGVLATYKEKLGALMKIKLMNLNKLPLVVLRQFLNRSEFLFSLVSF